MIKVLSCKFEQFLGPFTMLLVEMSSETKLFRHLSNHVFGVRIFGNTKSMRVAFLSKFSKINAALKNAAKSFKKVFCFMDNCIWTGIIILKILRTGYLLSSANVLTSSPKIWHVNQRNFFQLNPLGSDQYIW